MKLQLSNGGVTETTVQGVQAGNIGSRETREDMMRVDRVLVPLDGSPLAEMALPMAIRLLSDKPDATLILLRAAEARALPGIDPTDAQVAVIREADAYLKGVAVRLRDADVRRVRTSVWYGAAAAAIVDGARASDASLIVMTTHGRSGLGRLLLGSVAESVLRGTETPILRVRADDATVEMSPEYATAREKEKVNV
jgi:nucleotide-binding universal stress UspA family protein